MEDFIDRTLIKLKRQYLKDEVVAALIKQLSEKDIELGKLKSEIDYLQSELQTQIVQKEVNSAAKIEARKDELYKIQLETNRKQREKIRQLIHDRNDLIAKNFSLENRNAKRLEMLEKILNPKYMNDTFTWKSICDAVSNT